MRKKLQKSEYCCAAKKAVDLGKISVDVGGVHT
jgi:hypothetical protein